MTTGMPELGSKITLISKADIRYEGRLFTVDPQECTIALASVRSFGTEDRDTQYPVPSQNQVYDYILFRGSDIKDIRVMNGTSQSQPLNDPAIMQLSVPPTLSGQTFQTHPVLGHFAGAYGGIANMGTAGTGMTGSSFGMQRDNRNFNNPKPNSVLELFSGSRSNTPGSLSSRVSTSNERGVQTGGSNHNERSPHSSNQRNQQRRPRERINSRSENQQNRSTSRPQLNPPHNYQHSNQNRSGGRSHNFQHPNQNQGYHHQVAVNHHRGYTNQGYQPNYQYNNNLRRNWINRGPARTTSRGPTVRNNSQNGNKTKNTLKFDKDYDFEQANTEFEELRNQLGKLKLDEASSISTKSDLDKKEDSGNETGAGETEQEEEEGEVYYDKAKSFFDKISCDAVERAKGKSQRIDWRVERKLNTETFGVPSARRGNYRNRGGYRDMSYRTGYKHNYRHLKQNNNPNQEASNKKVQQSQAEQQKLDEDEKIQNNIDNKDSAQQPSSEPIDALPECSYSSTSSDRIRSIPEPTMAIK